MRKIVLRYSFCAFVVAGVLCAPYAGAAEDGRVEDKKEGADAADAEKAVWPEKLKAALERSISLDMKDTPLEDAVSFLQTLSKTNIIVDPNLLEKDPQINLRIANRPLLEVLESLGAQVGAQVQSKGDAVYIGPPLKKQAKVEAHPRPELTEANRKKALEAIRQLAAEEFADRQQAHKNLEAIGPSALTLLEESAKKETDAEVGRHLKQLIIKFKEALGEAVPGPDMDTALATKVTFEFVDTPLKEAIAYFKEISKLDIRLAEGVKAQQGINLRVTDMTLDLALEWVAKLHNLKVVKSQKHVTLAP